MLREMVDRAMAAGRLPDVIRYGALRAVTADVFRTLPAGVLVGLFEALTKMEATAPRARASLALCASMKVDPIDPETFVFFGAGLWTMAARAVLDASKREPDDKARVMLIEVVDGLLQDSSAMLLDFVNIPGVQAAQDAVSTDVSAEVAGEVPPADDGAAHRAKVLRERRLALADAIDGFVTACEQAPGCGASQVVFFDRIAPAFDDLIKVETIEVIPAICVERDNFAHAPLDARRHLARKYRMLARVTP